MARIRPSINKTQPCVKYLQFAIIRCSCALLRDNSYDGVGGCALKGVMEVSPTSLIGRGSMKFGSSGEADDKEVREEMRN